MYKSRKYIIVKSNTYSNYEKFKHDVFQKVKKNWRRSGNEFLGLNDSKVHRLFTGKQKDFDMIMEMAEFMKMEFIFKIE